MDTKSAYGGYEKWQEIASVRLSLEKTFCNPNLGGIRVSRVPSIFSGLKLFDKPSCHFSYYAQALSVSICSDPPGVSFWI